MTLATDLDPNTEFNYEFSCPKGKGHFHLIRRGTTIFEKYGLPHAQGNQEPTGRALGIPAMHPSFRMGGRKRAHVGNCLFHQQKHQRGVLD